MSIDKERMELWASALESGEHTRITHSLCEPLGFDNTHQVTGYGYCALGVGQLVAEQHGVEISASEWKVGHLSSRTADWYGLDSTNPILVTSAQTDSSRCPCGEERCMADRVSNRVSDLNDSGASFWEIAQLLRAKYLKEEG